MTLFEELKWRGLMKDMSNEKEIERLLNEEKITFYWGTDPSADSLHIGHLASLLLAKRLADAGHHPILLVGGATGMIGDPKPTTERAMQPVETIHQNYEALKKQIQSLFGYEMVNNYDWTKDLDLVTYLREYGKFFNVNYMLGKDIVNRRLDTGITYAEFSYMIMQAIDFLYLYEHKNCIMQVEGSDQWGNITAGIDLIRKKLGKEAFGFTMPLILDEKGNKFGKSEGNALWLDRRKASSYDWYQYLINSDDSMVIQYLKVFTFLSKEEIEKVEKEHLEVPEKRIAQKVLAEEIITFLHGRDAYLEAVRISESLFSGDIKNLNGNQIEEAFKGLTPYEMHGEKNIIDLLVDAGICSSKREAREFVTNNSISINGDKVITQEFMVNKKISIDNKYVVIRRGKKKYYIVKLLT